MRRGAAESAIAHLRRALEEPPPPGQRPGLLLELGAAEALSSAPEAVAHLREAYDTLTDPGAAGRRPRTCSAAGSRSPASSAAGVDAARRAIADLPPGSRTPASSSTRSGSCVKWFGSDADMASCGASRSPRSAS